eukprot:3887294-Rhodomonas_salina.4
MSGTGTASGGVSLRARYAMSGTDLPYQIEELERRAKTAIEGSVPYAPMRLLRGVQSCDTRLLRNVRDRDTRLLCDVRCWDTRMRCPALRWRMVVSGEARMRTEKGVLSAVCSAICLRACYAIPSTSIA